MIVWEELYEMWLTLYIHLNEKLCSNTDDIKHFLPRRRKGRRGLEAGMGSEECRGKSSTGEKLTGWSRGTAVAPLLATLVQIPRSPFQAGGWDGWGHWSDLCLQKNLVLFDVCRQAVLCSHWPSTWQPSLVSGFHVIVFCSLCASSSNIAIMTSNIITTILIVRMINGSSSPRASSNRQLLSFPCHVDQIPANSQ